MLRTKNVKPKILLSGQIDNDLNVGDKNIKLVNKINALLLLLNLIFKDL